MNKEDKTWEETVAQLAERCVFALADPVEGDRVKISNSVKVFSLYYMLDAWVNDRRIKENHNIREFTKDTDGLNKLRAYLSKKIDDGEYTLSDDLKDLGAVLAVSFSGFVAARLDSNFEGMKDIYGWCEDALEKQTDYSIIDHPIIDHPIVKAADCYYRFGAGRGVSEDRHNITVPPEKDLQDILDQAEEECKRGGAKDNKNTYIRQLRVFLLDAIMQLPPYRQDELRKYPVLLDINKYKVRDSEGKDSIPARVYYSLSKASYATKGERSLDLAIKYAVNALQGANPADIGFIELCRQNLLILEQEKVARKTTKDEALKEAKTELEKDIIVAKSELHVTIRKETRDLQMRVIEILGIFLAVTGVGVTAVGGIAVSGGFWDRLGIYIGGGLSIMILFGFLKYVVIEPIKRDKDAASDGTKSG